MQRIQLSRDFYLDEFTRSQTAERLGRPIEVQVGSQLYLNLKHHVTTVMQPLRTALGVPVYISSGVRPWWLNNHLGGSDTSDHLDALATDFNAMGLSPLTVTQKIVELDLPFKQCIHEFGRWVHLSSPPIGQTPRRQCLTIYRGEKKNVVLNGLHPTPTRN